MERFPGYAMSICLTEKKNIQSPQMLRICRLCRTWPKTNRTHTEDVWVSEEIKHSITEDVWVSEEIKHSITEDVWVSEKIKHSITEDSVQFSLT